METCLVKGGWGGCDGVETCFLIGGMGGVGEAPTQSTPPNRIFLFRLKKA